jgi:hypothetical protein
MVIYLRRIEVKGKSIIGNFSGLLEFTNGLQVVSAQNAYGKSLAAKAVVWCLGLEPIFGNPDNDPIRLPEAVREDLELIGQAKTNVVSSESRALFGDDAGRTLELTRSITGGDPKVVLVTETEADGTRRTSKLLARRGNDAG